MPISHIASVHPEIDCTKCSCTTQLPQYGEFCYKATSYETTRLLAARLGLAEGKFSQRFQSRLSDKWLKPYSDKLLIKMAGEGVKNILIVSPAFMADCLETTVELVIDYKNQFKQAGGENLTYVESLNDLQAWIEVLKGLIEKA